MLINHVIRSAAAFGGAPFRLNKCTALGSAASGAAGGASIGIDTNEEYVEIGRTRIEEARNNTTP